MNDLTKARELAQRTANREGCTMQLGKSSALRSALTCLARALAGANNGE